jgi:ribosomal protein L11 methyltransferase
MLELFPEGFEETAVDGRLEAAAYTDAAGVARARAAFGAVDVASVRSDWADRWREFHGPARVGPLWLGPPWLDPDEGTIPIVIDPGRAFGTGAHPTTRLCLEFLLELPRTSVVDAGCGSGVVAIAAAKLGFGPVVAVDLDAAAVEAAARNAATNEVEVQVLLRDVLVDELPAPDVCVANIALGPAEALMRRRPAPFVVTSGYLDRERLHPHGYRRTGRRTLEGWAADVFARQ